MEDKFPMAMPHGEIQELFGNVFFVTGSIEMRTDIIASRNMMIVREGQDLTLINTVRLSQQGLEALEMLGTVKHVLKLGAFHGIDDAFYVDRYKTEFWSMPGMTHREGLQVTKQLTVNGPLPIKAKLFSFETSLQPETLILLERDGGILMSCDSLQNWSTVDEFFSEQGKIALTEFGMIKPANLGKGWLNKCKPKADDFNRLLQLNFEHLLPSHGTPIIGSAKQQFTKTIVDYLNL